MLYSEEYVWEQKVDGLQKLGRGCESGCGENSNELKCSVKEIEWVAEQLLASQEGLFCMTLIVIHWNDFDSYKEGSIQSSYSTISLYESVYHSLSWQGLHLYPSG